MNLKETIKKLPQQALKNRKAYQKAIHQIKELKSIDADELFQTQHDEVFSEIDCLKCANCCKTTPPLILNEDINSISKSMNISAKKFMTDYVKKDEDGDFIFNQTPCPFLGADNFCSIYSFRPKACREYPHTQQKKVQKILDLTIKNAEICPAVARILDNISSSL